MDKEMIYIYVGFDGKTPHEMRKNLLHSLYGNALERKRGSIDKFNSGVGFKDVVPDYVSQYPVLIEPRIKVEDEYQAPVDILIDGLHIDLRSKFLVKFVLPNKFVECKADKKYSYKTEEIAKQFVKYLRKVYPTLEVSMKFGRKIKVHLSTFALDFFYRNMSFDSGEQGYLGNYTVEFSSHRMLTDNEINSIMKVLNKCVKYSFHIEQYWCETCASYHKKYPYHIEIVYD